MPELPRRKVLAMEVGALAAVILVPVLVHAMERSAFSRHNLWNNLHFAFIDLARILPIAFVIWSSGDRWKTFGIRRFRAFPDLLIASFLTLLLLVTQYLPSRLQLPGLIPPELRSLLVPSGPALISAIVLATVVGAVFEELFFRGYLIPRLEEIAGNVWIGVVVSALLFGIGHLYQGPVRALMAVGMGLAYGIAFVGRRNIGPLIVAHTAFNLIVRFPI